MTKTLQQGSARCEIPDDWTYIITEDEQAVATPKRESSLHEPAVVLGQGSETDDEWPDFVAATMSPLEDADLLGTEVTDDSCRMGFVTRVGETLLFHEVRAGRAEGKIWYVCGTSELGMLPLHVDELSAIMDTVSFEGGAA